LTILGLSLGIKVRIWSGFCLGCNLSDFWFHFTMSATAGG